MAIDNQSLLAGRKSSRTSAYLTRHNVYVVMSFLALVVLAGCGIRLASRSQVGQRYDWQKAVSVVAANTSGCSIATGVSCGWRGNCASGLGPTTCDSDTNTCLCQEGFCANELGVCTKQEAPYSICPDDKKTAEHKPAGWWRKSCTWRASTCDEYNATCTRTGLGQYYCQCIENTCRNVVGKCQSRTTCSNETGGTCHVFGCRGLRGPTVCDDKSQCICKPGYCAVDLGDRFGMCVLRRDQDYITKVAPVNQETPEFPAPHNQIVTALAFSGGGARAMTCALGVYRALFHLGLMEHVDAISSVSGGSWASAIYMFANRSQVDLLGNLTTPEQLSLKFLNVLQAEMGEVATVGVSDFVHYVLTIGAPKSLWWPTYIGRTILRPFGLDGPEFMASSREQVEQIVKRNPSLKGQPFCVPQPGRPKVFVMGGSFVGPIWYDVTDNTLVSLQMSPDYTGSPFWPDNRSLTFVRGTAHEALFLGGGLVETFAFGSSQLINDTERTRAHGLAGVSPPPYPFSLALAVGISSDAPAGFLKNLQGLSQFSGLATATIPDVTVWPFLPHEDSGQQRARRWHVGDGGTVENTGILPMLQRGAKRIVMWISTEIQLGEPHCMTGTSDDCTTGTFHFCGATEDWAKIFRRHHNTTVDCQLTSLFGYAWEDQLFQMNYTNNQVFDQSELVPLLCEMQTLKIAGKPIVVRKSSLRVKANSWWGLTGGNTVEVVFCYLDQASEFEKRLPEDTRLQLGRSKVVDRPNGEFAHFPMYKVTGQVSQIDPFKLTRGQVNLLAAQAEYSVRQNGAIFGAVLQRPIVP